jgi:hypothetical protein
VFGGLRGDVRWRRDVVVAVKAAERAAAMMSALARKVDVSSARISRSASGIWPDSWAATMSMQAWRSGGRVGVLAGSVVRAVVRIWVVRASTRALVRFCAGG